MLLIGGNFAHYAVPVHYIFVKGRRCTQLCTVKPGVRQGSHLGRAKVAQLELMRVGVHKQVLGFDVSMTHAHAVYVRQRSTHLQPQGPGHKTVV